MMRPLMRRVLALLGVVWFMVMVLFIDVGDVLGAVLSFCFAGLFFYLALDD